MLTMSNMTVDISSANDTDFASYFFGNGSIVIILLLVGIVAVFVAVCKLLYVQQPARLPKVSPCPKAAELHSKRIEAFVSIGMPNANLQVSRPPLPPWSPCFANGECQVPVPFGMPPSLHGDLPGTEVHNGETDLHRDEDYLHGSWHPLAPVHDVHSTRVSFRESVSIDLEETESVCLSEGRSFYLGEEASCKMGGCESSFFREGPSFYWGKDDEFDLEGGSSCASTDVPSLEEGVSLHFGDGLFLGGASLDLKETSMSVRERLGFCRSVGTSCHVEDGFRSPSRELREGPSFCLEGEQSLDLENGLG